MRVLQNTKTDKKVDKPEDESETSSGFNKHPLGAEFSLQFSCFFWQLSSKDFSSTLSKNL